MSWHETPAGTEIVIGADFGRELRYWPGGTFTISCPGNPNVPHADGHAIDVFDSYAADNVSALAAYDLVQIYTTGANHGGGVSGGWHDCGEFGSGVPEWPAAYTGVSVEIAGLVTELRSAADGTLRPILNAAQPHFTPDSDGLFMRHTALTWDGQDPTNGANRSVWLPSEIIGVIGAVHIHHDMVDTSVWDVTLGTRVRALNVISGSAREATEEPVICFV